MLDPRVLIEILGEPTDHGRVVTPTPDSRFIWTWACGCVARGIDDRAAIQLCAGHNAPE
ncbi:MAG: hypothetical protein NVSMB64_04590 [Candidatus Velthaea sp.]